MSNESPFIYTRPIIKIDGEEDSDLRQAVTSFVVNLPLTGMAHGEITANNWITNTDGDLGYGFQSSGFGKAIEIVMEGDDVHTIFAGEITAVEERYGDGSPQIIFLVQDKLHRLARQRNNRVFEDQSPDDIISTIANEFGLESDVNVSTATATYHQLNESDLAFLMRLVSQFGMTLRVDGNTLRARLEEEDPEPVELSAQDSALKVRLLADLNQQANKIVVKGFNVATNEAITGECESLANPPDGLTAKDVIDELTWPGENIVPQPFPRSQSDADEFAKGHFTNVAKRFIRGDIHCVGEPQLKSGREIDLSGVSGRFAGKYQIVHCAHCFSSNGFETHLKINRADGNR